MKPAFSLIEFRAAHSPPAHKKTPFRSSRRSSNGQGSLSAPLTLFCFARCKRKFTRQAGASALPGRGNSRFFPRLLEGSRRRCRLLRVHSHSHGDSSLFACKRRARKRSCAMLAQDDCFAIVFSCVCLLHGAADSPGRGPSSPESHVFTILPELQPVFKRICWNPSCCLGVFRAPRGFFAARIL